MLALTCLASLFALGAGPALAAGEAVGIVGRYPDPGRVAGDYADDAERFVALNVLYFALSEATQGRRVPGAYEKESAYMRARGEIQDKYDKLGASSDAAKRYSSRAQQLFASRAFKQSVLARYRLPEPPPPGQAARGASSGELFPPSRGDVSDAAIKAAFFEALPVWGGGTLFMIAAAWFLMRSSGIPVVQRTAGFDASSGTDQLPEPLRVISVPGRSYAVEWQSGEIVDKETTVTPVVHTTTTGGQLHVEGGQVYQTPVQTQTTVSSLQKDVIWLRTPDRREVSWTLTGGGFKTRQGHIVSGIVRPLRNGGTDFLLAYNHTTDQMEEFSGVQSVHGTRFFVPWVLTALAGSVPGAFGLGLMFHRLGGLSGTLPIALTTLWIEGVVASTILAAFIVAVVGRRIVRGRNARFRNRYVPEFRRFLSESTPRIQRETGRS